ncbi:hypothetical protein MDAP_002479 [Mitosporidium daphniae]
MRKVFFLLIDGLSDNSYLDGCENGLDYKTPMQMAKTPTLDALASSGALCGIMDPVAPGIACGSDTAHLSIFGYDPYTVYKGRGAFESIGAGIDLAPGDIAFKCNFATLREADQMITSRRVEANFDELGPYLCEYLQHNLNFHPDFPNHKITFKYAMEHRLGISISGPSLSDKISGTDPLKENFPLLVCVPTATGDQDAEFTCKLVNCISVSITRLLKELPLNEERRKDGLPPLNVVLFRGAASICVMPPFPFPGFMIAPTCIISGIGRSIALDIIKVPGATGDYHSNLHLKVTTAMKTLLEKSGNRYQFAFVHIKAVDHAGHDGDLQKKIFFIEQTDKALAAALTLVADGAQTEEILVCVTGDHSTPTSLCDHSNEPVPILLALLKGPSMVSLVSDARFVVPSFDEISCPGGALGRFSGRKLLPLIEQLAKI